MASVAVHSLHWAKRCRMNLLEYWSLSSTASHGIRPPVPPAAVITLCRRVGSRRCHATARCGLRRTAGPQAGHGRLTITEMISRGGSGGLRTRWPPCAFAMLELEELGRCVATTGPFSQHANQFPFLRVLRYLCMARPISSPTLQRASHDQSRYASASSASTRTVTFSLRRDLCDAFPGGRPARAWLFFRLPGVVDFTGSLDLECGTSSEISPPSTPLMPVVGTLPTSRQPELLGHPAVIVQRL